MNIKNGRIVNGEIKITNYKGKEYEGYWNGKIYNSIGKASAEEELVRIYIANEPIHVTKFELLKVTGFSVEKQEEQEKEHETIKNTEILLEAIEALKSAKLEQSAGDRIFEDMLHMFRHNKIINKEKHKNLLEAWEA